MGAGIAQVCVQAGLDTVGREVTPELGERGRATIERYLGRGVGMHFFNPAPVMPLVEIVRTELTDPAVHDAAYEFAERLGKEPIRCSDTPGFVVNRVLIPVLNDCVRVLDEAGVTPADLDKAMLPGT